MSSLPQRIIVTFADPELSLRVQVDRTNGDRLVVKSHHPEAIDNFAIIAEADIGIVDRQQGSSYFIVFVDRTKFLAALPKVFAHAIDQVATGLPDPAQEPYDIN